MEELAERFGRALDGGGGALDALRGQDPVSRRDRFMTLLAIYDLCCGDVATTGDRARYAGHPVVAELKWELESAWLAELDAVDPRVDARDVVSAMRALAARDRLPPAYEWIARDASWDDLVRFLALEGGPDGGFDDLVAACQVGLSGSAKMELARNYWDEMGNGDPAAVHTDLHHDLVAAIAMPRIPRADLPDAALERAALGGLLATNHWLQPEMLGALGLIELQAGPRCRKVLTAFDRLGAPRAAYPFYEVHAEVDPRHGKDWLELAIVPLAAEHPDWVPRMLRGAAWRSHVNAAFLDAILAEVTGEARAA